VKQEKDYNFWPAFSDLMLVLVLILVVVLFSAITRMGNESQMEEDNLNRFTATLRKQLNCSKVMDVDRDLWTDLLRGGKPIGISYRIVSGTQVYRFGADVLFASGSDELLDQGRGSLKAFAACLKENRQSIERIQIQGHTDTKEGVSLNVLGADGLTLAAQRAMRIYRFLASEQGVDPHEYLMSAETFGSCMPIKRMERSQWLRKKTFVHNSTEKMRSDNRRIEIQVKFKDFYDLRMTR